MTEGDDMALTERLLLYRHLMECVDPHCLFCRDEMHLRPSSDEEKFLVQLLAA